MLAGRKVVQIAAVPQDEANWGSLYALCDDGSIFRRDYDPDRKEPPRWVAEPAVPQADPTIEEVLRQLILPWSEFSSEQLDRRQMFDPGFREAIKAARRLLGWRPGIGW